MVLSLHSPYKDTQALYVIRWGRYDNVFRIRYTGIENQPPSVDFSFEDGPYDIGETVEFDGSNTTDADGDDLTYEWYFGDDETSNETNPTHIYESPGQFKVTLIVRDELGQAQQMSQTIVVGTPPTVNILLPEEGQQFAVGDILTLKGEAFHENGTAFEDSQLLWEVRKHVSCDKS
jgi:PKD repeat protein